MIPNSYLTQAQVQALVDSLKAGSGNTTQCDNSISSTSVPTLNGYITGNLLNAIMFSELISNPTYTINEAGLTTQELSYLNGMRDRIVEAWADAYYDVPLMAPNNARNLRSGQTVANAIDLFLQCIFQFDTRFGARNRLPENNYHGLDAYQLPARSNFVANPYIMTVLGLHGAPDVVNIDDTGTSGVYQVTTNNAHGLYDGMAVYSNGATGTAATNPINVSEFDPFFNSFTTSGNHNLMDHQRFHCDQANAGHSFLDPEDKFFGYQRRPYVNVADATNFSLYRDYALTDQVKPAYYNGTLTYSDNGSGVLHIETNKIQMFIDGMGYTPYSDISNAKTMTVTSYDQYTGEFTHTQLWTAPGAGLVNVRFDGIQGATSFNHKLYYKTTGDYKCKLYYDTACTNQFFFNRWNSTEYSGKATSTTRGASTIRVNFSEPHNMLPGGITRLANVTGSAYDAQTPSAAEVPLYYDTIPFEAKYVRFNSDGSVGLAIPFQGFTYARTTDGGVNWTTATLPNGLAPDTTTVRNWNGFGYSSGDDQFLLVGSVPEANPEFTETQNEAYYTTDGVTWGLFDTNPSDNISPSPYPIYNVLSDGTQFITGFLYGITTAQSGNSGWANNTTMASGGYSSTLRRVRPQTFMTAGSQAGGYIALNDDTNSNSYTSYVYSTSSTWTNQPISQAWDSGATPCVSMAAKGTQIIALSETGNTVFYTTDITSGSWSSTTASGVTDWVKVTRNASYYMALANTSAGLAQKLAVSTNGTSWTLYDLPFGATNIFYVSGISKFVIVGEDGNWATTTDGTDFVDNGTVTETPYWTVPDNTVYEDGQIIRLFTSTVGWGTFSANNGTAYTWSADIPTATSNYYRVKRVSGYTDRIEIYRNSAMTALWTPWSSTTGTFTISGLTIQPVFYAKTIDTDTVELYVDSALTNPWFPSNAPSYTGLAADFRSTDLESLEADIALSGAYIKPQIYFKTSTYSSVDVYWDKALTTGVAPTTGSETNTVSFTIYTSLAEIGSETWTFDTAVQLKPIFHINALDAYPKVFELFVDSGLTIPYNTPAISTPQTSGSFVIDTYGTNNSNIYKITDVFCVNPGSNTYWYKDYVGATEDRVNAQLTGQWFTRNYQTNYCEIFPSSGLTYEFDPVNNVTTGVGYFGYLRHTKSGSDETTAGGRKGIDTTLYAGVGSPVLISKQYPGRFSNNNPFLLWTRTQDDVGTAPSEDPINQNAPEWDEANGVDQALRRWPTHIQPSSVAWSIEQPNQTLDSMNYTRYTRSKEITQYRLKLAYRSMTREEFRPFLNIIQAARGSFKPFRYTLPTQADGSPAAFAYQNADSDFPFEVLISRSRNLSGSRVIEIDGLPCERGLDDPVISSGHSISLNTPNTTGQLAMIIHDMATNVYGEANIRVNNAIPTLIDFGHLMDLYPTEVDVFIDGNSIDVSVDTRGYHQFEVELVTKRIF